MTQAPLRALAWALPRLLFSILLAGLGFASAKAQAPPYTWAADVATTTLGQVGTADRHDCDVVAIATTAGGQTYVTGRFKQSVEFGAITLTDAITLAKLNAAGQAQWNRTMITAPCKKTVVGVYGHLHGQRSHQGNNPGRQSGHLHGRLHGHWPGNHQTLAAAGATVVVPARSPEKAQENLAGVANVDLAELDLLNPASIDAFAASFRASGRPLHLPVHNAGIMSVPLRRTSRGFESQRATNYLAPFQITARLWEALEKANDARVINVSSRRHQFATFDFEDPNFKQREYETLAAYGQSKTALNLFTLKSDNRAKPFGIRIYAVYPGNI